MFNLVKTVSFYDVNCDVYNDTENNGEYFLTREQIGQALEYGTPRKAIANIHERNKERLDKFSTVLKMRTVEGDRAITRDLILYSAKGAYEICRLSSQPKADEFFDFIYDMLEDLRKGKSTIIDLDILNEVENFEAMCPEDKIIAMMQLRKEKRMAEERIIEMKPKVEVYEEFMSTDSTLDMGEIAKSLAKEHGLKIGRNKLFEFLRDKKVLMSDNDPYQKYVDAGYFKIISGIVNFKNGKSKLIRQTRIFPKGAEFIMRLLKTKYKLATNG